MASISLGADVSAPLRYPIFRRIWLASLLSNLGQLIQGVGAAWLMTELTRAADMVALVQTASMLPLMLVSIGAGALADMYDRRLIGLVALSLAMTGAMALTAVTWAGLVTPHLLLIFCFVIGSGMALFSPAWSASVSEQVPAETLPAAIALNSISYNIARSFGPAIGGILVAMSGAIAAFAVNALLYIPLILVLFLWQRRHEPPRLPPERIHRAIVSGFRYIANSPPIRIVLVRTVVMGLLGGSVFALLPLVVRDQLHGGARIYGVMLGAFGMGAVAAALNVAEVRKRFGSETAIRACTMTLGVAILIVALSHFSVLTCVALFVAGAMWMLSVSLFNIGVQLSAPRWVAGRSLAAFQASVAGGIAFGSWGWGALAQDRGVATTLLVSGLAMLISPLIGLKLRMPRVGGISEDADPLADPEVRLGLTARSGPIVVEIEYRVDPAKARLFYGVMQKIRLTRQRNGGYGWSIARDIADPWSWTERYHCPTWLDYLRMRSRATQAERDLHDRAFSYHEGEQPIRVRRMLERPLGSVRWQEAAPDPGMAEVLPLPATPMTGA